MGSLLLGSSLPVIENKIFTLEKIEEQYLKNYNFPEFYNLQVMFTYSIREADYKMERLLNRETESLTYKLPRVALIKDYGHSGLNNINILPQFWRLVVQNLGICRAMLSLKF